MNQKEVEPVSPFAYLLDEVVVEDVGPVSPFESLVHDVVVEEVEGEGHISPSESLVHEVVVEVALVWYYCLSDMISGRQN